MKSWRIWFCLFLGIAIIVGDDGRTADVCAGVLLGLAVADLTDLEIGRMKRKWKERA